MEGFGVVVFGGGAFGIDAGVDGVVDGVHSYHLNDDVVADVAGDGAFPEIGSFLGFPASRAARGAKVLGGFAMAVVVGCHFDGHVCESN